MLFLTFVNSLFLVALVQEVNIKVCVIGSCFNISKMNIRPLHLIVFVIFLVTAQPCIERRKRTPLCDPPSNIPTSAPSNNGQKGQKGEVGSGSKGQKGEVGFGSKGQKGIQGPQGLTGGLGVQGPKGATGVGIQGLKGDTGSDGAKGVKGGTCHYSYLN